MLIAGIGVGSSAGIYVALNLLGAGGGRPDSAQVVQVVNATLCAGNYQNQLQLQVWHVLIALQYGSSHHPSVALFSISLAPE
jgi:hypothetical protein